MLMLRKIDIKGYRSIKEVPAKDEPSLELRPLNLLIGANGAGKSNFISFFKMLNEMMGQRLQTYVAATGGSQALFHFGPKVTPEMEATLEFVRDTSRDWYHFRLRDAAPDQVYFEEEELRTAPQGAPGLSPVSLGSGHRETRIVGTAGALRNAQNAGRAIRFQDGFEGIVAGAVLNCLGECRAYHFHDTTPTARMRQRFYINDNRWLLPDAGNLAAMLYLYRQRSDVVYNRIVAALRQIMPEFDDFDLAPDRLNPSEILLNWRMRGRADYLLGPHQMSDGTLRAAAILTLLLQPKSDLPGVIILDEPELGLHPQALEMVAGLLRSASAKSQVIVATQSQTFVDWFEPEEIITVESHEGQSRFRRLDAEHLKDWLEDYSIGELWQRNVLGGGPLP